MNAYPVSFDNTEKAFAYKSTRELAAARWLFTSMNFRPLVSLGTALTPLAIRYGLPVQGILRGTIFRQFVGGETLEDTAAVAKRLAHYGVQVILDYGVEGKQGEASFDASCREFIRVLQYAGTQPNVSFISVKVTGFARFGLLEKLDAAAEAKSGYSGHVHTETLNGTENDEWQRVVDRMERIVQTASASGVKVLVDAEESWVQDPVDALTMQMMRKYNTRRAVVYNTVQLYRHDRLRFLQRMYESADGQFIPGVKLVRGAYMEKERTRALQLSYDSPIQPHKRATDQDFDEAVSFCIRRIDTIALVIATHNEQSNLSAVHAMSEAGLNPNDAHVHFSQLYGMSDNITFNLAAAGYSVSKYVPFGPIRDVIPYLMRRAEENSSVSGQSGRELALILKELARRKAANR